MRDIRILFVLSIFLGAALAGCLAAGEASTTDRSDPKGPRDVPPPDSDKAQIKGFVTDDSLLPLADAQVAVLGGNPPVAATTDASGAYVLSNLDPGKINIAVQKLGYESSAKTLDVAAGQVLEANFMLMSIPIRGEARYQLLIGEGYFACGADTPVVTWGNLHACVWDQHKPNFTFDVYKGGLMGILQEVVWKQSSGLTAQRLSVYLQYKQVCNPFCSAAKTYTNRVGPSPIRHYTEMDKEEAKYKEDPFRLGSVTFPNRGDQPVVVVLQQRMTHYITIFYEDHGNMDTYTAIPDA